MNHYRDPFYSGEEPPTVRDAARRVLGEIALSVKAFALRAGLVEPDEIHTRHDIIPEANPLSGQMYESDVHPEEAEFPQKTTPSNRSQRRGAGVVPKNNDWFKPHNKRRSNI